MLGAAPDSPAPKGPAAPTTRVDWVAERLRDAILTGALQAGEKVPVASLCSAWHVSPTPMREALQRLASEGFVAASPQRGARVAELSTDEARELYELRLLLEPIALRQSLERFDDDDRHAVALAFADYRKQWSAGHPITYAMHQSHHRLHEATYRRCDSRWLLNFISILTTHSMRYSGEMYSPDQRIELHAALNLAIQEADIDAAVEALERHTRPGLEWTLKRLDQDDADD
jgi:GntR family carbon starvation induced transcriptional regulator